MVLLFRAPIKSPIGSGFAPEVDRLLDRRCMIREVNAPPLARGLISRIHDLEHFPAILPALHELFLAQGTVHEMLHLLREAVVPDLLEHRECVSLCLAGFLDGIAVARLAIREQRAAAEQVGARMALLAIDLAAVVDASALRPA